MSPSNQQVPLYSADGSSLGFRTVEAAQHLIAAGKVNAAYGRKGHLKAIFLPHSDGSNAVERTPRSGRRYSFVESFPSGSRCWSLKKLDGPIERRVGAERSATF